MLPQADSASWNYEAAAHLLRRAAFGGDPREIADVAKLGRVAAIDSLFRAPAPVAEPELTPPEKVQELMLGVRDKPLAEQKETRQQLNQLNMADLLKMREWWVGQMVRPESAALEKAVLFWHGHFATSVQKVKFARPMWEQNTLFRKFAFGNFTDLVKAISCDPAMVLWLDLQQSGKGAPNENFARELMELFTLGVGHYSENDIKESARSFTGYRMRRGGGSFTYVEPLHDDGEKTFMGKSGPFSGDDIIDIIFQQPACAEFICTKLWTFYAYEDPEPGVVQSLAATLRREKYEIQPVLREIFGSVAFYGPKAMATQIKSPAQFIAQGCRQLECEPPGGFRLQGTMRSLGQILFAPPNVKGWDGNRSWINTATLEARNDFSGSLPSLAPLEKLVTDEMLNHPAPLVDGLSRRLLAVPLSPESRASLLADAEKASKPLTRKAVRAMLAKIMQLPEYQLA